MATAAPATEYRPPQRVPAARRQENETGRSPFAELPANDDLKIIPSGGPEYYAPETAVQQRHLQSLIFDYVPHMAHQIRSS